MNSNNPGGQRLPFLPKYRKYFVRPPRSALPFIWIVPVPFVHSDPQQYFLSTLFPLLKLRERLTTESVLRREALLIFTHWFFQSHITKIVGVANCSYGSTGSTPCLSSRFFVTYITANGRRPLPPSFPHFLLSDRKMYFRFHFRLAAATHTATAFLPAARTTGLVEPTVTSKDAL